MIRKIKLRYPCNARQISSARQLTVTRRSLTNMYKVKEPTENRKKRVNWRDAFESVKI